MRASGPPPIDVNPFEAPRTRDEAPPPPVASAGFRSLTPLATAITVVMALFVLVESVEIVNDVVSISVLQRVLSGAAYAQSELEAVDSRTQAGGVAGTILYLGAAILFCFLMPRANRNARAFGSWPLSITPRWAAGVFFVPIWSLYKPYRAMKEIWLGSDPDVTKSPWTLPFPSVFAWWWGFFLVHNGAQRTLSSLFKGAKTTDDFLAHYHWDIVRAVLTIVAAALALVVVRALAQRQDERQRRHPAGTPVATVQL